MLRGAVGRAPQAESVQTTGCTASSDVACASSPSVAFKISNRVETCVCSDAVGVEAIFSALRATTHHLPGGFMSGELAGAALQCGSNHRNSPVSQGHPSGFMFKVPSYLILDSFVPISNF